MKLLTTMLIFISFNVSGQQMGWSRIIQPVLTVTMPEYTGNDSVGHKFLKQDTVKVMMLVCDTSVQNGYTWSAYGHLVIVSKVSNTLERKPYPEIISKTYLDYKKRKLKPSFIVWQSFEIK